MPKTGEDKKFDERLKVMFGASQGAYSPVTATEFKDGQVTLTGDEKRIAAEIFGDLELEKYRGARRDISQSVLENRPGFRLFPSGKIVKPIMNLPKIKGGELRLYFNKEEFRVEEGKNWGIFERDGEAWLCHFSSDLHEMSGEIESFEKKRESILEFEDDEYQSEANRKSPSTKVVTSTTWDRDPSIAREALRRAKFECELFPSHPTFPSAASGNPFMEAHHLIPMKLQKNFSVNLDQVDNICCLNPWSHRLVHFGEFARFESELYKIAKSREKYIRTTGLVVDDVMAFYAT